MNYESIVKKPNPFSGLSVQSRQRLVVYLCYVATPTMTPDMVRQRWGEVLSADDWPLAHEAMDLIDEIKKELVKRKRCRSILCVVLWTALILLCVGTPVFIVSISQQTKKVRLAKEHAKNARQDMQRQCQEAKGAGAKEYAIAEWNGAVGKWNSGDDKLKTGDYVGASELYRQSESLFVEAERISNARKAAELTAKLSELQDKAVTLVKESDKWWKWSVDDNALLEMGNAINMLLVEGENISGFSVANRDELEEVLVRCYELAANDGNGEACFRLFLLFGGESEKTLVARIVIKKDKDLSLKYLKRAADKGHPVAKEIYEDIQFDGLSETLKKDANDKTRRRTGDKANRPTRGPVRNSCSECGGTGYARYVIWTPTFLSKSAYRKEVRHMKCKKCRGSGRASF